MNLNMMKQMMMKTELIRLKLGTEKKFPPFPNCTNCPKCTYCKNENFVIKCSNMRDGKERK